MCLSAPLPKAIEAELFWKSSMTVVYGVYARIRG
jgi:hypothetical protein